MLHEKQGRLAIWVGTIKKKSEFNAYMKETYGDPDDEAPISPFCADMGDSYYDHDFVFGQWHGVKPQSVEQLLDGWAHVHTFLEAALKLAKTAKIAEGNTMMIAYDHELKPGKWPGKAPVRFLGNLPYSKEPPPLAQADLAGCRGHQAAVARLCFAPDGKTLVSGGDDGTLIAWDVATGVAITPPRYAFQDSLPDIYHLAFSSNGQRCMAATLAETCIWDPYPTVEKFSKPIKSFAARAITSDGKLGLATSIGDLWVYDLASGKPVPAVHRKIKGHYFALLPKDQIVTTTKDGQLMFWNGKTAKLLATLDSPQPAARELVVAASGRWGVTYGGDHAVIWDLEKRRPSEPLKVGADIEEVLIPDDALWVVGSRRKPFQVRSLRDGKLLRSLGPKTSGYRRMQVAGSRLLGVADDGVNAELWDLKTGKPTGRFPDKKKVSGEDLIEVAALSPGGLAVAVGHRSGQVQILRSTEKGLLPVRGQAKK